MVVPASTAVSATKWIVDIRPPPSTPGLATGSSVAGRRWRRSRPSPASTRRAASPPCLLGGWSWRGSPGPSPSASAGWRCAWTAARGGRRSCRPRSREIPGGCGERSSTSPRAPHRADPRYRPQRHDPDRTARRPDPRRRFGLACHRLQHCVKDLPEMPFRPVSGPTPTKSVTEPLPVVVNRPQRRPRMLCEPGMTGDVSEGLSVRTFRMIASGERGPTLTRELRSRHRRPRRRWRRRGLSCRSCRRAGMDV